MRTNMVCLCLSWTPQKHCRVSSMEYVVRVGLTICSSVCRSELNSLLPSPRYLCWSVSDLSICLVLPRFCCSFLPLCYLATQILSPHLLK